ncbi:MAG: UDP-N-acetylglucosamine 2-epimerase (non-hydrolyzing) [Desulfurococcaceae archaeon]
MEKVVSVVGARPNFVKLAGIDHLLREKFEHIIIHTGQHYDYELSKIFFDQLEIPQPQYYLGVGSGSHGYQVGECIKRVKEVLLEIKPDIVVVYGDTNSTLAGTLAAVKSGFNVAHVEAGLRVFDCRVPEEVNRRVVDTLSSLLFAPTKTAVNNLLRENVPGRIVLTGDIHVDVLMKWFRVADEKSQILEKLGVEKGNYVLVTIHRAENTDDQVRLINILNALIDLSRDNNVVFPIHPRTYSMIREYGFEEKLSENNILLIKPLGYLDFLKLLMYAKLIVTDSGGVQREAYLVKIPAVVLREYTEWVELLENGWVKLIDPRKPIDVEEILMHKPNKYVEGILGKGDAGFKIVKSIEEFLVMR